MILWWPLVIFFEQQKTLQTFLVEVFIERLIMWPLSQLGSSCVGTVLGPQSFGAASWCDRCWNPQMLPFNAAVLMAMEVLGDKEKGRPLHGDHGDHECIMRYDETDHSFIQLQSVFLECFVQFCSILF